MSKQHEQGTGSWLPRLTRRHFVKSAGALTALGTASLNSLQAWADELPRVKESSDMATALNYRHDAQTVDAAKRVSDRYCYNCALFAGTEDDAWAGCSIFPGKAVAGRGWCSAWTPGQ
jgi:uncharacterized protein (DUF1800 family)